VTVTFEHEVLVAAPPERVFALALDIDQHLASMSETGERAVAGVTTGQIGLGEQVTWKGTHFHVPFTMTSRVTELDRPHRFVDEQVRGPFRRWYHEHVFEAVAGGTRMLDRVRFDAPLGPIGRVVEHLLLARYLHDLITHRAEHLRRTAEGPTIDGSAP
jgi:ligand-binding SRPBCC domain-containing protein